MPPASNAGQQASSQAIRRAIWIVLGLLVVVLLTFAAYYISDRYFHAEELPPAVQDIEHLEDAVRLQPQDPALRIALAESYLQAGRAAKALEQAQQVLSAYPDSASALLVAGIAQMQLDRPEAALAPLERFVALRDDGPMDRSDAALEAAYYYLGQSYLDLERPADAVRVLEAALLINPVDADALYQLGLALHAGGQAQRAVEKYAAAVRLVPDFLEAYRAMARSYAALQWTDHATYAQGMVAFCQKDYEAAVAHLERATRALPDYAPAFLGLGLSYEAMGSLPQALTAIERTLKLDPDDFAAQQALGRIQAAPGMGN